VSDRIVLLSPRPGRINRIVTMEIDRQGLTSDEIRREKGFLDTVEDIWTTLKKYLDDERMEG
jgi:NitT/TauT family transport system ATP-binding protein